MNVQHGIVWQPVSGEEEGLYLPYFLEAERWHALTRGGVDAGERDLLLGILLGYREEPVGVDMERVRPHLAGALQALAKGFGAPSAEAVILSASAFLRERYGPAASRRALRTGVLLVPESSPIRSDLILDLSATMEGQAPPGRSSLAWEILRLKDAVRWDDVMPSAREPLKRIIGFAMQSVAGQREAPGAPLPLEDGGFALATAVKFADL